MPFCSHTHCQEELSNMELRAQLVAAMRRRTIDFGLRELTAKIRITHSRYQIE